ncbi:cytochrome c [Methylobacterium sp. J-067]|uniref:cytochrome c n=1 Tax=Methylobacterium sp. J-067 TaxID=2836648 RepID=UPI001FBB99D3|nr:cytochrome c [Methylobacterium sp. J-067]MCJ2025131.1 cytochrome c [Methylobacterium sp. J-067]
MPTLPRSLPAKRLGGALVASALVGAALVASGVLERSAVSREVEAPLTQEAMRALAPRGAKVAAAADCFACHTARGGAPYAGGLPLETPFGTIYATNITPSAEGIGGYSRADFHRALRDGIAPGGRHLYPAMPYTSYRGLSPDDVDALYAYMMSRPPVAVANRANTLTFPFDQRWTLAGWNILNLPAQVVTPDPKQSDLWNRGQYVADALGHCGECHTPRNALQAMRSDAALQGAVIEGVEAPDITPAGLRRMGFDPHSLTRFMAKGLSAQGGATHQMFDVVHYSTQHMDEADLTALSAYLFDRDALPAEPERPAAPAPVAVPQAVAMRASASYDGLCAGCHGHAGEGIPHVSVPLRSNALMRVSGASGLIRATLHGLPAQRFPDNERMEAMPGFATLLDDAALADLATWMRAQWGGQDKAVTPDEVARLRAGHRADASN